MDLYECLTHSGFKEEQFSLGALEAREYKFSGADGGINITKGFMTIVKAEWTTNLYKLTGSIIVSDTSAATEKEILQDFGACHLDI